MISDAQKVLADLQKAIALVGAVSEADGMPDDLCDKLINALAALEWVAQSLRCPVCGCWRNARKPGNG